MAEFKIVSWNPGEVVTAEGLNALVSRDDNLRETKVSGSHSGIKTGIKLISGISTIGGVKASSRSIAVKFGQTFSSGCRPAVTASITSTSQAQLFTTITGPGSVALPTRDGFDIKVTMSSAYPAAKRKLNTCYVSWIAMGY